MHNCSPHFWYKVNLCPSLSSFAECNKFSLRIILYLPPFIFPSSPIKLPVPAEENNCNSLMNKQVLSFLYALQANVWYCPLRTTCHAEPLRFQKRMSCCVRAATLRQRGRWKSSRVWNDFHTLPKWWRMKYSISGWSMKAEHCFSFKAIDYYNLFFFLQSMIFLCVLLCSCVV